jgi:hypothetical protein
MDKPKKLILDYSKWRCGDDGKYAIGKGNTCMLNSEGFMCCLGLISKQYDVPDIDLLDFGIPKFKAEGIPLFSNAFVSSAIMINDNKDTTPEQKIESLTQLLQKEGIELEVINKH